MSSTSRDAWLARLVAVLPEGAAEVVDYIAGLPLQEMREYLSSLCGDTPQVKKLLQDKELLDKSPRTTFTSLASSAQPVPETTGPGLSAAVGQQSKQKSVSKADSKASGSGANSAAKPGRQSGAGPASSSSAVDQRVSANGVPGISAASGSKVAGAASVGAGISAAAPEAPPPRNRGSQYGSSAGASSSSSAAAASAPAAPVLRIAPPEQRPPMCSCMGTKHNCFCNCINCGKIICESEVGRVCSFCGADLPRAISMSDREIDLIKAKLNAISLGADDDEADGQGNDIGKAGKGQKGKDRHGAGGDTTAGMLGKPIGKQAAAGQASAASAASKGPGAGGAPSSSSNLSSGSSKLKATSSGWDPDAELGRDSGTSTKPKRILSKRDDAHTSSAGGSDAGSRAITSSGAGGSHAGLSLKADAPAWAPTASFASGASNASEPSQAPSPAHDGRSKAPQHVYGQSGVASSQSAALEAAIAHKNKLLDYDKNSTRRTVVRDDDGDWFAHPSLAAYGSTAASGGGGGSNAWLSPEERAQQEQLARQRADAASQRRRGVRLELDFTGGRVEVVTGTAIDDDRAADAHLLDVIRSQNSAMGLSSAPGINRSTAPALSNAAAGAGAGPSSSSPSSSAAQVVAQARSFDASLRDTPTGDLRTFANPTLSGKAADVYSLVVGGMPGQKPQNSSSRTNVGNAGNSSSRGRGSETRQQVPEISNSKPAGVAAARPPATGAGTTGTGMIAASAAAAGSSASGAADGSKQKQHTQQKQQQHGERGKRGDGGAVGQQQRQQNSKQQNQPKGKQLQQPPPQVHAPSAAAAPTI